MTDHSGHSRVVPAVHGQRHVGTDAPFEAGLSAHLKSAYTSSGLLELYGRYAVGDGELDHMLRRAIWRALARRFGAGVTIESGAGFKHPETFDIGNGVFIGSQSYIQGRFDGRCVIGDRVWIGPQAYFDARDLVIENDVGWGPGAKVLGSVHTGLPLDMPIIRTDLEIKPVRICEGADVGTNAVILPGVTVGAGSIVGAGAVVTEDVAPNTIVAGVPARVIRTRDEPRAARESWKSEIVAS
jgi:acetyltransferase-like isoleucine patch superfamily enzyme